MLSEQDFINAASTLSVEVACIKAVTEVESQGTGFQAGKPRILFEPHIFWKELKSRGINPLEHTAGNEDILYLKWGSKPYGRYSQQHGRLERAKLINEDAALASASWGMFQILGKYYMEANYASVKDFVADMYKGESQHLNAFCNLVIYRHLDDELRGKLWAQFAVAYNGTGYTKNRYDKKLAAAYNKFKK